MDERLIELARRGDRDAFTTIAASRVDRCYALAYRILRDPYRAEDAVQQALFGAWRDLPSLSDLGRFEAWLYRLVVHACYVEARSDRRWRARIQLLREEPATGDVAGGVVEHDELEAAFAHLSPEHQAVVVLHHYMGYQLTEIAETLGIPAGTARSRLHHATGRLRAAMSERDAASGERSA
jgi:RNA polymerase sigma-70 factor (ECF subfamily)